MGRAVPSSSEQLDLLSRFGDRCSAASFFVTENWTGFFSLLPGKQRRAQGERGFRTPACGESVVGLSYFSVLL